MLLVLEGLDGAGKSTQLKALEDYFKQCSRRVHFMHFPDYQTPVYGELIARFLRGDCGSIQQVDPYLVALLYAGNRAQLAPQLTEWLSAGDVVLLDRYVYSNIAFQCAKLADPIQRQALRNWIMESEFGYFQLPRPQINLFLDVPLDFVASKLSVPREGDDRTYLQGKQDIHEASVAFQQQVRQVYLEQVLLDSTFKIVSCADQQGLMAPWEVIFERIMDYIR